jgi:polyhydroxyalkanoate synthesis repressor PhaR
MTAVLQQPDPPAPKREAVVIKKYANRRLYNPETSAYVTLDDLASMVRSDRDFVVYDAKTGDDLTHSVLTQIIVEQEAKSGGQTRLPVPFRPRCGASGGACGSRPGAGCHAGRHPSGSGADVRWRSGRSQGRTGRHAGQDREAVPGARLTRAVIDRTAGRAQARCRRRLRRLNGLS